MSLKHVATSLAVLMLALCAASNVCAQQWQPFVNPDEFDIDFQLFAPAQTSTYGDDMELNTGWYFCYDRVYWNVSRPQASQRPHYGDWTWGNRFDIGYMTEERSGWLLNILHVDGPTLSATIGNGLAINNADLSGVEFNKVWRLRPFHHGSVLEPFIGVRYGMFRDRYDPSNRIDNSMFGGQVGARWFTRKGRWILSSECRFFAMENFQYFTDDSANEIVPGGDIRAEAAFELTREIALRFGFDILHHGRGIARGPLLASTDGDNAEDLTMYGLTFGVTFNR